MKIQIINGPNLNLLGKREPGVYGATSFEDYLKDLRSRYADIQLDYYQSNVGGELINKIHEVGFDYDGMDSRTLDLHIQRLRKKLGWQEKITTIRRYGYRLEQ